MLFLPSQLRRGPFDPPYRAAPPAHAEARRRSLDVAQAAVTLDALCPWCQGRGLDARPVVRPDGRRLAVACPRCGYASTWLAVGALALWGE